MPCMIAHGPTRALADEVMHDEVMHILGLDPRFFVLPLRRGLTVICAICTAHSFHGS